MIRKRIERWMEILLATIILLSGLGFLVLGIAMLADLKRSGAKLFPGILCFAELSALCLTVAYKVLRRKPISSSKIIQCCRCGATTEIADVFMTQHRSFSSAVR